MIKLGELLKNRLIPVSILHWTRLMAAKAKKKKKKLNVWLRLRPAISKCPESQLSHTEAYRWIVEAPASVSAMLNLLFCVFILYKIIHQNNTPILAVNAHVDGVIVRLYIFWVFLIHVWHKLNLVYTFVMLSWLYWANIHANHPPTPRAVQE